MLEQTTLDELAKKMDFDGIAARQGGGNKVLMYVKGQEAIRRANEIFGYGAWGYRVLSREKTELPNGDVFYTSEVEVRVEGAAFPFVEVGIGIVKKPFNAQAYEMAIKEAATDGVKRALKNWGSQFGLDLYDVEGGKVVDDKGNEIDLSAIQFRSVGDKKVPFIPLAQGQQGTRSQNTVQQGTNGASAASAAPQPQNTRPQAPRVESQQNTKPEPVITLENGETLNQMAVRIYVEALIKERSIADTHGNAVTWELWVASNLQLKKVSDAVALLAKGPLAQPLLAKVWNGYLTRKEIEDKKAAKVPATV